MATLKEFRNMVWQHEFDIADLETNLRVQRIERVRRAAVSRSSGTACCGALPTQLAAPITRELGAVAAHVPNMTRHGHTRLRQRGITVDQVVTLIDFGSEQRSHGASRFFLDRQARVRIAVEMPEALRSLPNLDIHVVLADDGRLITATHRTKRIRRDIQKPYRRATND
jgi:hypothetical protein